VGMQPKPAEEIKVLPDAHTDFVSSVSVEWLPTLAVIAVAVVVVLGLRWIQARNRSGSGGGGTES